MREHRNATNQPRSFDHAPARSEGTEKTARAPRREPAEEVRARLATAENTLAMITADSIPKLAAAQATEADRRPARKRRAAYDLARESVDAQLASVATARATAAAYATRHRVDAAAMLEAFDQKVTEVRRSLAAAPPAPARFEPVPGEDDIAAAITMPLGPERNTALVYLFSQLDRVRARVLERRLAHPDDEDRLAQAFSGVVEVRADLLGILAGTKQVRIDPRKVRLPPKADASSVGGPADRRVAGRDEAGPRAAPQPTAQAPSAAHEDARVAASAARPQLAQHGHAAQGQGNADMSNHDPTKRPSSYDAGHAELGAAHQVPGKQTRVEALVQLLPDAPSATNPVAPAPAVHPAAAQRVYYAAGAHSVGSQAAGSSVQRQATGTPPSAQTPTGLSTVPTNAQATGNAPIPSNQATTSSASSRGGGLAVTASADAAEAYHASTSAHDPHAPASRNADWAQVHAAATDDHAQETLDIAWIDGLPKHLKDSIDEGFADSVKDATIAQAKVTDTGLKGIDKDVDQRLHNLRAAAVARLATSDPSITRKHGRDLEQVLARDQAFVTGKAQIEADRRLRKEQRELELRAAADGPMAAGSRADTVVKPSTSKVTRLEGKALARTNFMSWAADVLGSSQAAKQHFQSIREVSRQPGMFLTETAKGRFEAARADFEAKHADYTFPSTDVAQSLRGFHQTRQGIGMLGHALGLAFDLLAYDNPNQKLGETESYGYLLNRFGGIGDTRGRSVMTLGTGAENTVAQLGRDTAANRSSPAGDVMVERIRTQFDEMVATSERLQASMTAHLPELSEARDQYFNSKDTEKDLAQATQDEKNADKIANKRLKDEKFNGDAAEKAARHEAIKQELTKKKQKFKEDLEAAQASIDAALAHAFADWIATINTDITAARARKVTSEAELAAQAKARQDLDAIDVLAPTGIDTLNAFADLYQLKKPRQTPRAANYKLLLTNELRAKQKPRDKTDPLSPEYVRSEIDALDAWVKRLKSPKQVFGEGKIVPPAASQGSEPGSTTPNAAGAASTTSPTAGAIPGTAATPSAATHPTTAKHWATKMQVSNAPVMQFIEHGFIRHDDMPARAAGGDPKHVFNAEVAATLARFGFSPGAAFRDTMHFDFIEGYSAAPGGRSQSNMNKNKYGPSGDIPRPAPRTPAPATGSRG